VCPEKPMQTLIGRKRKGERFKQRRTSNSKRRKRKSQGEHKRDERRAGVREKKKNKTTSAPEDRAKPHRESLIKGIH